LLDRLTVGLDLGRVAEAVQHDIDALFGQRRVARALADARRSSR
jgi:hypothetical protein